MSNNFVENTEPSLKDLRTFSLIWCFIFIVIGILPLLSGDNIRMWAVGVSGFFLVIAFIRPIVLAGFYRIWVKLGQFVGGVVSRVVLIILFYGLITPFGLAFRIMGKDLLNKSPDSERNSYWILRETQPGSLENQF